MTTGPTVATRDEWLQVRLEVFNGAYQLLDLAPVGRDEDALDWTMAWLHRHDAYPDAPA